MQKLNQETTFKQIRGRLEERGDMPVFSASVNRIAVVGSDPTADAMSLTMEILKDANLTAKILRLANSPIYNRGQGKIPQLSRAVIIIGFDTIKNVALTLKLIDSFKQENPDIDVDSMLVNAFLAGSFVRSISAKCGIREIEQAYVAGLLHNLGEIVAACTMPDEYREIQKVAEESDLTQAKAEQMILGTTFRGIGKEVARCWEFPNSMINSMDEYVPGKSKRVSNQAELSSAVVSLANKTTGLLYANRPDEKYSMAELTLELAKVSGIRQEDVTAALEQSFKESCELAQHYGLNRKTLTPKIRDNNDEALSKLARQFSFYAKSEVAEAEAEEPNEVVEEGTAETEAASEIKPAETEVAGDSNALLGILFELTTLISKKANFNEILQKVLEGMHKGVGFDRAVLCLLSPDHKSYGGRLHAGKDGQQLKEYFNFPVNREGDLFSKIILEGTELLVSDVHEGWLQQLPKDFAERVGARSFMLGTLKSKQRPLGIFYADNAVSGRTINKDYTRSFMQLVAQAQLALQVR
jgi:HD-like signal output (HDOD) protein